MSTAARLPKIKAVKAETDIAVLQVQVKMLDEKFDGIKDDIKEVKETIVAQSQHTTELLRTMQSSSSNAHASLSKKVADLEKWRWMVMGGAATLGALGFHLISKLLGV